VAAGRGAGDREVDRRRSLRRSASALADGLGVKSIRSRPKCRPMFASRGSRFSSSSS
jgi:hypothetical protein